MRMFTVLGIFFYAGILILIGVVLIVFSLNIFHPQDVHSMVDFIQSSTNYRIIIGLAGALLILISFSFAQLILGRFQREKTIAFTTASGEVTVALSAVEDLIKQFAFVLPEIKELKPDVIATKRGIIINLRTVLKSEANLPELTARLQELTKSKIQEVLGIDEDIIIKIHISKISPKDDRDRKRKEFEKEEPSIPYSGYGRV
jgi:uncharacterized alkaline shock family protein YloU